MSAATVTVQTRLPEAGTEQRRVARRVLHDIEIELGCRVGSMEHDARLAVLTEKGIIAPRKG